MTAMFATIPSPEGETRGDVATLKQTLTLTCSTRKMVE
ncbi:unnamed protein product [Arabidopsis halleri]